jgi:sulfur relay (sulfurtransferase) DsrC/TusE family protein
MDTSLENILKALNKSTSRLSLNRKDEENDSFRHFSNLLIGETTDIISEFINNLDKQKCNQNNLKNYNQMIEYVFMHVKVLARNMASNQKQFEILEKILKFESKLSEEDIVDIDYCLEVVERNIDLLKEFKRENRTQINEFLKKRRSIDKITTMSDIANNLISFVRTFAFGFAFIPLMYLITKRIILNSNNEENNDTENIFKSFETIKRIKNRVKDVLHDENERKKNLDVCKSFLEESKKLNRIINEIFNIDVHAE